jgi:hypothetical protein
MVDAVEATALRLRNVSRRVERKAAESGLQTRIHAANGPGNEPLLAIYEDSLRTLSPDQTVEFDPFIELMSGAL